MDKASVDASGLSADASVDASVDATVAATVDAQWTLSGRYSGRLVDATVDSIKNHTSVLSMKKEIIMIQSSFFTNSQSVGFLRVHCSVH